MKEDYSAPQLEVLGDLRGVTSLVGPYSSGDIIGGGSLFPGDEESGGTS